MADDNASLRLPDVKASEHANLRGLRHDCLQQLSKSCRRGYVR